MRVLPLASLALVLALSGCSEDVTEVSPEEKRNNFDFCVIEERSKYNFDDYEEVLNRRVREQCSFHLR